MNARRCCASLVTSADVPAYRATGPTTRSQPIDRVGIQGTCTTSAAHGARTVESCLLFGAPRASAEIALARSGSRHYSVLVVGLGGRQGAGDPRPPLGPAPVGPRSCSPV